MAVIPASQVETLKIDWLRVEQLLASLATLARAGKAPVEFRTELLQSVAEAVGAVWSRYWSRNPQTQELQPVTGKAEIPSDKAGLNPDRLVSAAVARNAVVDDRGAMEEGRSNHSGQPGLRIVCPISGGSDPFGALEFQFPPGRSEAQTDFCRDVLMSVTDVCVQFELSTELGRLRQEDRRLRDREAFVARLHGSLNLDQVAATLANEGCGLLACDRLTLLLRRRGRFRVFAVSNVARVSHRSKMVKLLESLARRAVASRQELQYRAGSPIAVSPQIQAALDEYLDQSSVRAMQLTLLRSPEESEDDEAPPLAVVVAERFSGEFTPTFPETWRHVCSQSETALQNALALRSIPGSALFLKLGVSRILQRVSLSFLLVLLLIASGYCLWAFSIDFAIECRGDLQPAVRRHIFAAHDGVVEEPLVRHQQQVAAGDVALTMRNLQMELEHKRLNGEMLTARKRLSALEAAKLQPPGTTSGARPFLDGVRRSGEEAEVKQQIASLESQLQLLQDQQQQLILRSPIAGEVLTWNVEQTLRKRPVQRGQQLLTVAETGGNWILELQVRDKDVGHLRAARGADHGPLDVTFVIATDPAETHSGKLIDISNTTERDESDKPIVRAVVEISASELPGKRPGATVLARVDCGRRAIGYVWFRDLIDAVRTFWAF